MSRFDEFSVVDEITLNQVRQRLQLSAADLGPEIVSFRAVPGAKGTAFVVLTPLLAFALLLLPGVTVGTFEVTMAVVVWLLAQLALGAFWIRGWMERHRVCRHGLVLGRRGEYAVPWSTIDPGRVRLLRRANLLTRHGIAAGRLLRPGETLGHALLVNGLDDTPAGHERLAVNEQLLREGRGADEHLTCFDRWVLAGRHAPDLVRAMEEAMVADGYPAQGMAAEVVAHPLVLAWTPQPDASGIPGEHLSPLRRTTDPVIGTRAARA